MKKISTLVLLLMLMSLSMVINAQKVAVDHYASKNFDCAIFPDTYPTELGGKAFIPTHDEVDNACKAIIDNLKNIKCSNKDDRNEIVKNLAKFKIQVFGYADKTGNRIVFMNCFRNDGNKDKDLANNWLTDLIEVQDGGTYFWTVKFNLSTKELFDFKENGNG